MVENTRPVLGGSQMKPLGIYFELSEFTVSATAQRELISNVPTKRAMMSLRYLVKNLLDPLREYVGRPVRITSGYRSEQLNRLIGGSSTSQHMLGEAADIKCGDLPAELLADLIIKSGLDFGQLIWYSQSRGGHVHISCRDPLHQREVLSAPSAGGYVLISRDRE